MIEVLAALAWVGVVWWMALRKPWHRNGRVVAGLLAAMIVLAVGLWSTAAFAWFPGVALTGIVVGLTEIDSNWVRTMSREDWDQMSRLIAIDADVSAVMAKVADAKAVPHAVSTLDRALIELRTVQQNEHWDQVASLKVEEYTIARAMITAPQPDAERLIVRQREARDSAKSAFGAQLASLNSWW